MARKSSGKPDARGNALRTRTQSYARREVASRDEIERFLIVCEGEKTEPNYFRKFRVPSNVITVQRTGYNTDSLIREAIRLRDEAKETADAYDQVWCVFDRDSFPQENCSRAFQLAKKEDVNVAFSNEAFEIWYLMHFAYHDAALSRTQYGDKLTKELKRPYAKNSETIYDELYARQPDATTQRQSPASAIRALPPGTRQPLHHRLQTRRRTKSLPAALNPLFSSNSSLYAV